MRPRGERSPVCMRHAARAYGGLMAVAATRRLWAPPKVERVAAALVAAASFEYQLGTHFHLVTREPGSERPDLPIWAPSPHAVSFTSAGWGPVERSDVPGVPGAFVLSNVLTETECDSISALSEAMGYTEDAPVSLGRRIRRNENCVIIADETLWQPIWERVRTHMPPSVDHPMGTCRAPVGLNQRWRLYKYGIEDVFRMHTDGSWPGSGLDGRGRLVRDIYGDRWSQLTFLIYLDGDYEGGETTFFVPSDADPRHGSLVSVAVPKGSCLLFFHGEHEHSLLHEGSLVTKGVKRIVRSDVLYTLPGASAEAAQKGQCAAEELRIS